MTPEPKELYELATDAFAAKNEKLLIFATCCNECGITHLRDHAIRYDYWMFSTVDDYRYAGECGRLFLHFGGVVDDTLVASNPIGKFIVDTLESAGLVVKWAGVSNKRISVEVDAQSFADHAIKIENRDAKVPSHAERVECDVPGYAIHTWQDKGGRWWYDVSEGEYSHERVPVETREEALAAARELVKDLHLDTN